MSTGYELTGRTRQKARTRAAMVTAARQLLAEGVTATVEQAADRAGVSRTTAYRYFANQRALLIAAYPALDLSSLLGPDAPPDPAARLDAVVDRFTSFVRKHEPELRAMLRLSLDPVEPGGATTLPLRQGRAIQWFTDALAPVRTRVGTHRLRTLVLAIRAATGIEALVWLVDVAGLSRDEAVSVMKWSAAALLQSALAEAASPPRSTTSRRRAGR